MGMPAAVPAPARLADLEARLAELAAAPAAFGTVEMIVVRPAVGERRVLEHGTLDTEAGLVGDSWSTRRRVDLEAQITLMGARVIALLAGAREYWPLAGDQLFVDLDLSKRNVPPGTRLAIGAALLEVSTEPHTGCRKFKERFGADALRFVSTAEALEMQLRGVNARVLRGGDVAVGDRVTKV